MLKGKFEKLQVFMTIQNGCVISKEDYATEGR